MIFKSNVFTKYVFVFDEEVCLNPSENYFDLIPGVEKRVSFERLTENLRVVSLYDFI